MSDGPDNLLFRAKEITDPAERATFLDKACEHAAELRARLEQMLAAEREAESFFRGGFLGRDSHP